MQCKQAWLNERWAPQPFPSEAHCAGDSWQCSWHGGTLRKALEGKICLEA